MVTAAVTATMSMEWVSAMVLASLPLFHQDQGRGNGRHGGDQENILPKNQKANNRGSYADDGGQVILCVEPLLHKDRYKEGRQHEVDALVIDGDEGPGEASQHGPSHPVALVQGGYQQTVAMAADALGELLPGNQGVGFVGQGEDQVGLFLPGTLVGIHHGNAVEEMTGVDHQGGQGGDQQACSAGHQADGHVLHGPGVDEQAHGEGPSGPVAIAVQEDAKAEAQKEIAGHYRHSVEKCCPKGLLAHGNQLTF